KLQRELNKRGQSIPNVPIRDEENLVNNAQITASNELKLEGLPADGFWKSLTYSTAQLLPLQAEVNYSLTLVVKAEQATTLDIALRTSLDPQNHTPEKVLETQQFQLEDGEQEIEIHFEHTLDQEQYGFICLMKNAAVSVKTSKKLVSGLVAAYNKVNKAVSNFGKQEPPEDIGIDAFEFWCPNRRPDGNNLAFDIAPAIHAFDASNLNNGYTRPNKTANSWVGHWDEKLSRVRVTWSSPQTV